MTAAAGMGPGLGMVPGGGAPDGGFSAAYAAWAAAYGGGMPCGGMPPAGCVGPCGFKGCGEKGGKGRGFGKGKGKGKAFKGGSPLGSGPGTFGDAAGGPGGWAASDPRRQIELAQKRAKQRDRSAISQAQRSAQQRFERDLLERVQGSWVDASDPSTSYVVEGALCSVSGGKNGRVFRNRLGVYGGELCWDARRFWHNLDINKLPPLGEEVERVEWNPGEGSPETRQIVWLRAPPPAEGTEEVAEGEEQQEGEAASPDAPEESEAVPNGAATSTAEAVAEAAVA